MMSPRAFAAETSTSAATDAKSPVRISSPAFPSVFPLFPPDAVPTRAAQPCSAPLLLPAAMRPFSQHRCSPGRSLHCLCAFSHSRVRRAPARRPSHVRDSSLHRTRRKRRAPARPRTCLLVLLRARQQRCGAQASCPSALACLRRDARRAACVALPRRAAPNDCSGRADAARRAVRRFDKHRAAGCPCRTASCGWARQDTNPGPERWVTGSGGKGRATPGRLPADTTPHRRRSAPIFTGLDGRGDGRRQHLASAEATRAARTTGHGAAGRDRGSKGATPDTTHLPAHPVGESHTRTSALGAGRSSCAEPHREAGTRRIRVERRGALASIASQHRGEGHGAQTHPGLEHGRSQGDAADDETQLALTGTAGRGARPRDTRG
ncbi:hypothetical protein ERJ75_001724200 [Trypanosoma vivax]|nr:hypothetical protein ERJ75_001724200 [Trypanosoma vivax]